MQRVIYEVYAKIVDSNGSYSTLKDYPKVFDSKGYGGDQVKTLQRAKGEFHATIGEMCKVDSRQIQTVLLMAADGYIVDKFSIGQIANLPDAES